MNAFFLCLALAGCGGSDGLGNTEATALVASSTTPVGTDVGQSRPADVAMALTSTIPTQSRVRADIPFSQMGGGSAQVVGTYPSFSGMGESGVYGSGTVLGNTLRFGKVKDPKGSGRMVFRHALRMPDDPTTSCCHRVDVMPPNNGINKETVYWVAFDMLVPSNTYFANDATTLANIHAPNGSGINSNWVLELGKGRFNAVKLVPGQRNVYWQLDTAGPLADQWVKVVVKFRLSPGSSGMLQVWVNGRQIVNDTGPNSSSVAGDYAKMAFYNYTFVQGWGDVSRPEREMFYGSYYLVKDAGYTFDQVSALLN